MPIFIASNENKKIIVASSERDGSLSQVILRNPPCHPTSLPVFVLVLPKITVQ